MKAKKYKVPVNKHSGNIPDYIGLTPEKAIKRYQEELETLSRGFAAQPERLKNWYKEESDWVDYQTRLANSYNYDWQEPHNFSARYSVDGFERGRSSATFIMKNVDTGGTVHMMASDLPDIIQYFDKGIIKGIWNVAKCGANYRLKFVSVAEEFAK